MKVHYLKILDIYFEGVTNGSKKFEVRFNDRNYSIGDLLVLKEIDSPNERYTGNVVCVQISSLLSCGEYVKEGFVILSISLLPSS